MTAFEAFGNKKGGVGKSTMTIQRSIYHAAKKQRKTLLIDLDPQGNSSWRTLRFDNNENQPLYDGVSTSSLWKNFDFSQVTLEPNSGTENLYVVYATESDRELAACNNANADRFATFLNNVLDLVEANGFDVVVVDCPPGSGQLHNASILLGSNYYIPLECNVAENVVSMIKAVRQYAKNAQGCETRIQGLIINKFKEKSKEDVRNLEDIQDLLGGLVLDTVIRDANLIGSATEAGVWVGDYKKGTHYRKIENMMVSLFEIMDSKSNLVGTEAVA